MRALCREVGAQREAFCHDWGLPDREQGQVGTELSEAPGGFDAERGPTVDESLRDDLWFVR